MTWHRDDVLLMVPNLVTYATLTTLIAVTLVWFFKRQQKIWLIEQIPGPKALPILGNALEVNVEPREFFPKSMWVL